MREGKHLKSSFSELLFVVYKLPDKTSITSIKYLVDFSVTNERRWNWP